MLTKTVRSRFDHQPGESVEGGKIIERRVVIPPDPVEKRRGVYEYIVEVQPAPAKPSSPSRSSRKSAPAEPPPPRESYTRSTPEEMGGVIRRLPSR